MDSDAAPKNAPSGDSSSGRRPFKYMKHRQVCVGDLKEEDVIIAVMGRSGSGKSSFINAMGGKQAVDHGLNSCTTNIASVKLESSEENDLDLILVYTPGFDNTNKTDLEILKMIADWLKKTYENKVKLSGILYLHRISDNRMPAFSLNNIQMFKQLSGKNTLENMILTTTMWGNVDKEAGNVREEKLKSCWETMIQEGSEVARYEGTPESAWKVVEPLLKKANDRRAVLLQEEMVKLRKQLPNTAAIQALYQQLERRIKIHDEALQKTLAETRQQANPTFVEQLKKEHADIRVELRKITHDMKALKLRLGRHLPRKLGIRRDVDDLKEEDVIIAVMGPTGSGKSSFINAVMGGGQVVGHGLESCTTNISSVKLESSEVNHVGLIFVDTPGFGDTNKTDLEILKMIADWLKKTYEKKVKLSGILYFHRISDNRMAGTPLKNLRMFKRLCGKNALKNIILTTTMWDEVDKEVGDVREDELKKSYWKTMIQLGSEVARYERTPESAWKVVEPFLKEANNRHAILLQEKMVGFKRQLPDTEAGQAMYGQLESLIKRRYETLQKIRAETRQQTNPGFNLERLREEYADIQDKLQSTIQDMRVLKLPLSRRLLRLLGIQKGRAKRK